MILSLEEQGDHVDAHLFEGLEGLLDLVAVVLAHVDHSGPDAVFPGIQGQDAAQQVQLLADAGQDQHQIHVLLLREAGGLLPPRQDLHLTKAGDGPARGGDGQLPGSSGPQILAVGQGLEMVLVQQGAVLRKETDVRPVSHVEPLEHHALGLLGPFHRQPLAGGQGEPGAGVAVRKVTGGRFPSLRHRKGIAELRRPRLRRGGQGYGQGQGQQEDEDDGSLRHSVPYIKRDRVEPPTICIKVYLFLAVESRPY